VEASRPTGRKGVPVRDWTCSGSLLLGITEHERGNLDGASAPDILGAVEDLAGNPQHKIR
jgi:hypothetical protein